MIISLNTIGKLIYNLSLFLRPLPILGLGMFILGFVLLLLRLTVSNQTKVDPLFYGKPRTRHTHKHFNILVKWRGRFVHCGSLCSVFAEFSFTCMVGLTNALEQDGFISGFMGFYLKKVSANHFPSFVYFFIMLCIVFTCQKLKFLMWSVSLGWAPSKHRLCCDDVILGRHRTLYPLPHHHPPHVQRVSCQQIKNGLLCVQWVLEEQLLFICPCRKSYRSLGLLWAGSSIANQIVHIPGVVIGEICHIWFSTSSVLFVFVYYKFLFMQVNTGLTFDQVFGGMSPSFWPLSGRPLFSLADPERCRSSLQTR